MDIPSFWAHSSVEVLIEFGFVFGTNKRNWPHPVRALGVPFGISIQSSYILIAVILLSHTGVLSGFVISNTQNVARYAMQCNAPFRFDKKTIAFKITKPFESFPCIALHFKLYFRSEGIMEKKCKAQIAVRLPKELQEAYRTEAKQQRRKPSELIRIALEAYAQSFEPKTESVAA